MAFGRYQVGQGLYCHLLLLASLSVCCSRLSCSIYLSGCYAAQLLIEQSPREKRGAQEFLRVIKSLLLESQKSWGWLRSFFNVSIVVFQFILKSCAPGTGKLRNAYSQSTWLELYYYYCIIVGIKVLPVSICMRCSLSLSKMSFQVLCCIDPIILWTWNNHLLYINASHKDQKECYSFNDLRGWAFISYFNFWWTIQFFGPNGLIPLCEIKKNH